MTARRAYTLAFWLAVALCLAWAALAQPITCTVASVTDGDTLRCADGTRIRLQGIAAPEADEPGGPEATAALRAIVEGQTLDCEPDGTMTWDRVVAVCRLQGFDIGYALVGIYGVARDCPAFSGGRYAEFETPAGAALPLPGYCLP